ncbi:MAG: glycerol-3-phosphate 1-O-acyltransferase PlsY [Eubacteriales bacterium]|nr:glycerol-3-phosphate 1-O-acyltransferase PlsY [Eubacteriales bacterium]
MNNFFGPLLSALIGYLLGCFATGLLVSKKAGVNIREKGSKSTGATNVSRILGIKKGLITFLGDFIKALLAVIIGTQIAGRDGALVAGLAAIIGHNWPLFFRFKGGKGISSSCAILLYLFPVPAIISFAAALIVIIISKYVSLGSLTILSVSAAIVLFTKPFFPDAVFCIVILLLGVIRHRSNLARLINGKENKFSIKPND